MTTASVILARLNAIGARVERRGDRVFVRAGRRPVPELLIEEARKAKAELAKTLSARAHARGAVENDEHLRAPEDLKTPESFASNEDAHPSAFDEHLRQSSPCRSVEDALSDPVTGAFDDGHNRVVIPMGGSEVVDEHLQAEYATPMVGDTRVAEDDEYPWGDIEYVRRGQDDEHLLLEPEFLRVSEEAADEDAHHAEPPPARARASRFVSEGGHAAAIESAGGVPAWVEGFALLDPNRPPADVPLGRWQTFIDDVNRFLGSPFCAAAATLGWGPHDLFGCDRDRPFARIDQAGLLWLLNGERLLAISEDTAVIETGTGARQVFRRRPNGAGRVLAWELRP